MASQNQPLSHETGELTSVLEIISALARMSADGDYIYRGEPVCYPLVSSSLYREYPDIESEYFNIDVVQQAILQSAKEFVGQIADVDLLTQLQHFGCSTNLIDFTRDYLVALFFACDGSPDRSGRVVLLREAAYRTMIPKNPKNRVIAQKSIFVIPENGYVEPDRTVVIPYELKRPILEHLRKSHGLTIATVYNDIHGFIRYRRIHETAYAAFYTGLSHLRKREYSEAIDSFGRAIELNPRIASNYANRGVAYENIGDYNRAILDHTRAIELQPTASVHYGNRANSYAAQGDFAHAMQDHDKAISLAPKSAPRYSDRGATYEKWGFYDRAIADYDMAIKLNPNIAAIFDNRGVAYSAKGEHDRAIQDHSRALELDSKFALAYNNRGAAYSRKGEHRRALKDFDKAIGLNPRFAIAYYNRGECSLCLADWQRAAADFSTAKECGLDIAAAFCSDGGSVSEFERKHGIRLPANIAAMLMSPP